MSHNFLKRSDYHRSLCSSHLGLLQIRRRSPVSYTHLDVYKRQYIRKSKTERDDRNATPFTTTNGELILRANKFSPDHVFSAPHSDFEMLVFDVL